MRRRSAAPLALAGLFLPLLLAAGLAAEARAEPGGVTVTILSVPAPFGYAGGTRTVPFSLTGQPGTQVTLEPRVVGEAPWLTVARPHGGLPYTLNRQGIARGRLRVSAARCEASLPSPREASLDVGATSLTLRQQGAPCTVSLAPKQSTHPGEGDTGLFAVEAPEGCLWSASVEADSQSWLVLEGAASGEGEGSVAFTVLPNGAAKARAGKIFVAPAAPRPATKTHRVMQAKGGALPPADQTPPTVAPETPLADAVGVGVDTAVTALFSEAMDAATITRASFTLAGPAGAVAGTVTYDTTARRATFTPAGELAHDTEYTVTVTAAAKDAAGNPIAQPRTWVFATAASRPAPYVVEAVTGMEFVWVPAGTFTMGDTFGDGSPWERPTHEVTFKEGYYLGKYEVTQGQWQQIMGDNPSAFSECGPTCPVETVSWDAARAFVRELNARTGMTFRLPTEAEWEYAASYGPPKQKYAGTSDDVAVWEYAWYIDNGDSRTHPVGTALPNALGLYDMSGNVWEWVADDWHDDYNGAPADGSAWVEQPRATSRVMRGGSWHLDVRGMRAAGRSGVGLGQQYIVLGFRLALDR